MFPGFTASVLEPVFDLNARVLQRLVDEARCSDEETRIGIVVPLRRSLLELSDVGLDRLARCPICLLDAGFGEKARWLARLGEPCLAFGPKIAAFEFPRLEALRLSQTLFMMVWAAANAQPVCAKIIFGMSEECLRVMRALTSVQDLIEECSHWVRPRWPDRPQVWQRLIGTAQQSPAARIPDVGVRALLQMLADLEPATRHQQ